MKRSRQSGVAKALSRCALQESPGTRKKRKARAGLQGQGGCFQTPIISSAAKTPLA